MKARARCRFPRVENGDFIGVGVSYAGVSDGAADTDAPPRSMFFTHNGEVRSNSSTTEYSKSAL